MKNVKMYRRQGDFLLRTDKKYKETGVKNKNFISILVPDKDAELMKRRGISYKVNNIEDTSSVFKSFSIVKIESGNLADDENKVESSFNQNALTIEKVSNNIYKLKADLSTLKEFTSTNPIQAQKGKLKWLGLIILTGEPTIVGTKFNDYSLTKDDEDESKSVGGVEGSFVFWITADKEPITFTMERNNKLSVIELIIEDTKMEE